MSARGRGMRYGTRHCDLCSREFEAHSSNHRRCATCAAVHQAKRMRSRPAQCDGCGGHFHRRDGRDKFCPECHIRGFGEARWAPGPELDQPCSVCGKHDLSVAPDLDVCATCVASPNRATAIKVSRRLYAYIVAAEQRADVQDVPAEQPTDASAHDSRPRIKRAEKQDAPAEQPADQSAHDAEQRRQLYDVLAREPDADATMRAVYEQLAPDEPYESWLLSQWANQKGTGAEHAAGKFSAWLREEARRYREGYGGPGSRYGRVQLTPVPA